MKPQALFIAQPTYATKAWEDRPIAAAAASKLAAELASHGYELGPPKLLAGGETQDIAKARDDWFEHVVNCLPPAPIILERKLSTFALIPSLVDHDR